MNLQNKDIKKIKNCINFAIQNNKNLVATDIDDLKEITSLLYFFQLENQKNNWLIIFFINFANYSNGKRN